MVRNCLKLDRTKHCRKAAAPTQKAAILTTSSLEGTNPVLFCTEFN